MNTLLNLPENYVFKCTNESRLALHRANNLKDGYRFLTWCKYGKKYNSATVIDGGISTHPDLII